MVLIVQKAVSIVPQIGKVLLNFAASKYYLGFYPGSEAVEEFKEELKKYKVDKGAIRILYGKVDVDLIKKIAQWCWSTGNHV